MKALLITPDTQSIETVEITDHADIARIIGYDTIISDDIGPQGDRLYFDEECFLRGSKGRFQIDAVIPVAGKGVIVGSVAEGADLRDVVSSPASIAGRIKYL